MNAQDFRLLDMIFRNLGGLFNSVCDRVLPQSEILLQLSGKNMQVLLKVALLLCLIDVL